MTIRVGVVIDPWDYPYNGTVVSTRRFVSALSSEVEFRLLAISDPESSSDDRIVPFKQLSLPGFNGIINRMKVPLANPWGRGADLTAALEGLDLVHMQFPFFLGYKVARKANQLGIPLLASFHVQPENLMRNLGLESQWMANQLYKLFIWGLYDRASLVLAPSAFAAAQLKAHGLSRPVEVLSNGVPEAFFLLSREVPQTDKLQLLSVGRLAPEKHQSTILSAVANSRFRDQVHVRLIGTGPLEQQLRALARSLDVDATIGPADDATLRQSYQSADLFVHAGEIELEGMSVLEAMAAGNAVLVSNSTNSATVEFVQNPESLFQHGDVSDLTDKIDAWLQDKARRQHEGEMNRERAHAREHTHSVDQLLETYQRLAGRARVD